MTAHHAADLKNKHNGNGGQQAGQRNKYQALPAAGAVNFGRLILALVNAADGGQIDDGTPARAPLSDKYLKALLYVLPSTQFHGVSSLLFHSYTIFDTI